MRFLVGTLTVAGDEGLAGVAVGREHGGCNCRPQPVLLAVTRLPWDRRQRGRRCPTRPSPERTQ